eukprot:TRINITY_DN73800_c0_g1_i1.p1 TRINITY_DN73800_c0_g1~~TRINITY_DN73800_c0_g1_i1.p1  ORF type:complete len:510 (-),score=128.99 TRINITY_DN73800_c0_g1_i1:587-2116(-)
MADDDDTLPGELSGLLEEEAAANQEELDDLFADYVSPEKDGGSPEKDQAMHDAEQRTALDQTSSEPHAPQTTALDQTSSEIKATEDGPALGSPGQQPEEAATNIGESGEEKLDARAFAAEPAKAAEEGDKETFEGIEADLEAALDEAMDDDGLEAALEGVLEEAMAEEASMQDFGPQKTGEAEQATPKSPEPPVPPPPSPWAEKSTRSNDDFVDESRFMRDENDEQQYKWKVDYASRGGGGKAMCRDTDCLERHRQDGVRSIDKGELRIGRRVLVENKVVIMWHHARCIFNTFLRSRKTTRVIESPEDLEGFEKIDPEDQDFLRRIIAGQEDVRKAQRIGTGPRSTPQKRGPDPDAQTPAEKRQKDEKKKIVLKKGDRCWAFCRVRPAPGAGAGEAAVEFAVKSPKPELGMVVEEERDGNFIVQFESAEHEKERLEKFQMKRFKKLKAWLRYPRIYEGKKQRIPSNWIQWSRPPPRMCSCVKQEWSHDCPCTGIACTRGTKTTVWGVCN